jgi:HSP20 family protein
MSQALESLKNVPAAAQPKSDNTYAPRVDIFESEDELVLYADMPGVKPGDADVRFENGQLVLHGRCSPRSQQTRNLVSEYGVGDFFRAFTINEDINPDKISADLKQGVLTVHLPKAEEVKPRKIAVKGE